MSDKHYKKTAEIKPNENEDSDYFIMDDILISTRYDSIKEKDIARLKKWNIKEVRIETVEDINNSDEFDFGKFLSDRKIFYKIYRDCLAKIKNNFQNFQYNNNIGLPEVKEITTELHGMVSRNINSTLSIANTYPIQKANHFFVRAINVSIISMMIGIASGFDEKKVKEIGFGAILYDVGMLKIKEVILNKVGKYTPEDIAHMKTHTLLGYKIFKQTFHLGDNMAAIPLAHHEQYNGNGYPRGLTANNIPPYARIIAIAQAFEGMIMNTDSHGVNRHSLYESMKIIIQEASRKFDPYIVKTFVACASVYPIGSLVVLNNGMRGLVFGSNKDVPMRPVIKIVQNEEKEFIPDGEVINLLESKTLFIKSVENSYQTINDLFDEMSV